APALSASGSVGGGAVGFSHRRVAGTACVTCHGPASGIGMSPNHIATTDRCESCHMTAAWLPVTHVDHMQVRGSCVSCHNGVAATGKGRNHIAGSDSCETCHTTNAWSPARFDHIGVAPHTCISCHDSIHATGLPANHVVTSAQCDTCHGTLGWKPAKLDHTTLTAPCASCHDNNIAIGVTPTHMSTARGCATCHSYPDWSVLHFAHTSASYPGEHRAALACTACHTTNTDQIPWASPADAGSCGGCHAKDFRPDLHPKTQGGLKYTASELRDCSGACHVYSDATLGTVAKPMPGPYHRVADAAFKH
ncbi:MAG: cytochrome C, partial [Gammaproteobacteria bacterium]|nr:cytochrome C [Gammaproteobacteria bacterium]